MPFHFAEARANLLTNDVGDAVTGTAEYKVCAAEVRQIQLQMDPVRFRGSYYAVEGPGPGVVDEIPLVSAEAAAEAGD